MPDLGAEDSVEEVLGVAVSGAVAALEGEEVLEEEDLVAVGSVAVALEEEDSVEEGVSAAEANSEVEELGAVTLAEVVSEASASLAVISEPVGIGAPVVARAASARAETFPVTARTSSREMGEWIKDRKIDRTGVARTSRTDRVGAARISKTVRTLPRTCRKIMMTTGMTTGMAPTIPVAAGTDGVDIIVDWRWALE